MSIPFVKQSPEALEKRRQAEAKRRQDILKRAEEMPRKLCECGCGTEILALLGDGRPRRFERNHGGHAKGETYKRATPSPRIGIPIFQATAACAGRPDLFFPPEGGESASNQSARLAEARALCDGCPAFFECRQWATEHDEHGIWAGESITPRRKRRAELKRQAEEAAA